MKAEQRFGHGVPWPYMRYRPCRGFRAYKTALVLWYIYGICFHATMSCMRSASARCAGVVLRQNAQFAGQPTRSDFEGLLQKMKLKTEHLQLSTSFHMTSIATLGSCKGHFCHLASALSRCVVPSSVQSITWRWIRSPSPSYTPLL